MSADDVTLPTRDSEDADPLAPGQLFGRYLIVDRVGAGGVGEVYAAYDPALDRRIALKVLRAADSSSATADQHASLIREAKALASLSHPNVVTVHDVGREHERTFIAMALVEGRDLKAWLEGSDDRSWQKTLEMFVAAGKGLAAAHAKGILHRDFKPANVLVGHDDWVRVSDFGLARTLTSGDTLRSELATMGDAGSTVSISVDGQVVGTPYYMAPEQLDGETTVRSDLYAFCLALHDALYHDRAFEASTLLELAVLKSKAAPKAPADPRGIPAEVRSAIERGLQPAPEDRWPSMAELLAVLERALQPRSRAAWPWLVGVGTLGIAAVAAMPDASEACSGARAALDPVWSDGRRQSVTAGLSATASPLLEQTLTRVTAGLDRYGEQWTSSHTAVCEATRRKEQSTALLDHRMACLQRQLLDLDAALDVFENADDTVVERAARVVGALPTPSDCESATAGEREDPSSPALEEARAELAQINARINAGLYPEADTRATALLTAAEALDAPHLLCDALHTRGNAHLKMGRIEDAVGTLERGVFKAVELGDRSRQARGASLLVVVEGRRAARPSAGLRWHRLASAALVGSDGGPREQALLKSNLAAVYTEMDKFAEAEAQLREALTIVERADLPTWQHAALLDNLGSALRKQARFDEALEAQEEAIRIQEEALGPDHPMLARALTNAALTYVELAKYDEGDARYARALDIRERTLGPDHPDVATSLQNMATSLYQRRRLDEALPLFERALTIRRAALPADHPRVLGTMSNVAQVRSEAGDIDGAAALFEEVLRRLEANPETNPSRKAIVIANFAGVRLAQRRPEDAKRLYEQALAIDEATLGPDHPTVAMTLSNLGNVLEDLGDHEGALAAQRRSLKIREDKLGPDHPDLIWTLLGLSGVHQARGEQDLAIPLLQRGLEIAAKNDTNPLLVAGVKFELAQALVGTGGDKARARTLGQEALATYHAEQGRPEDISSIETFLAELD